MDKFLWYLNLLNSHTSTELCPIVPVLHCYKSNPNFSLHCPILLEKQSKFPQYNMKWRGKPDTTWNILRSITFSLLHFMFNRGKSISFGTVYKVDDIWPNRSNSWKIFTILTVKRILLMLILIIVIILR